MSPTLRVVSAPPASEPSTAGADDADVVPEASAASVPLVPPVAGAESPPHATRAAANVVISSTVRSLPISVLTSSDLFAGGSAARVTDPGSIAVTGRAAKPPRQAGRWHGFRTGGVPDPWHLEDRTPRSPRAGRWLGSRTGGAQDPWHLENRGREKPARREVARIPHRGCAGSLAPRGSDAEKPARGQVARIPHRGCV